jgi:hypothetical protein
LRVFSRGERSKKKEQNGFGRHLGLERSELDLRELALQRGIGDDDPDEAGHFGPILPACGAAAAKFSDQEGRELEAPGK